VSFREKSVQNILEALEASRSVPFERVLFALGIRYVGETVAKKLALHFMNIEALMAATTEELTAVPEVGEVIANSVFAYFRKPAHLDLIARLRAHGLQFTARERSDAMGENKLQGKSFVVSGVFSKFSRDELKATIERYGGRNVSAISAQTDYVLAGENMGPAKLKKATDLGVTIIGEDDFLNMIA
jgi:DNA ligase (NAD+)